MFSTHQARQATVEAVQNDGTQARIEDICRWVNSDEGNTTAFQYAAFQYDPKSFPNSVLLKHKESNILYAVRVGDYVIRISKGEYFVMEGYQFQEMYNGEWDKV